MLLVSGHTGEKGFSPRDRAGSRGINSANGAKTWTPGGGGVALRGWFSRSFPSHQKLKIPPNLKGRPNEIMFWFARHS